MGSWNSRLGGRTRIPGKRTVESLAKCSYTLLLASGPENHAYLSRTKDRQRKVSHYLHSITKHKANRRRFIGYLQECGFYKEKEVSFPYKQSALMKLSREAWNSPFL